MIGRKTAPPVSAESKLKGFDDFDLRLGDVMRGERATLGKSLLDVQRELKIKATYIAAIENADPSAFETKGFVAGYVRSYARYLGLDPEWAYARFCEEGQFVNESKLATAGATRRKPAVEAGANRPSEPLGDPKPLFLPQDEGLLSRIEPGAIGSLLVLMSLVVVIGYGGWSVFREIQKVQFAPVEQAPGVATEVATLVPGDAVATATETDTGPAVPTVAALDRLYRSDALDVPVLVPRDGPIATLDPSDVGTLAPRHELPSVALAAPLTLTDLPPAISQPESAVDPAENTPPRVQVTAAEVPPVQIFAVRPSWIRVRAADGTVLFEKILDAGERYILPKTEEPPTLRAGNAGSVYFMIDGKAYGPAGTGPSVVKNVTLSSDDLTGSYALADLSKDTDLAHFVALAQAEDGEAGQ